MIVGGHLGTEGAISGTVKQLFSVTEMELKWKMDSLLCVRVLGGRGECVCVLSRWMFSPYSS